MTESQTSIQLFLHSTPRVAGEAVDDQTRRYKKDVIRAGRWYVPHLDSWLSVDNARMDAWVASFEQMHEVGVRVDLTLDHLGGAEAKRGDVMALYRVDDTLWMEVEVYDDETVTLLHRCPEVSLEMRKDWRDGHGNSYAEALTAVSIVRQPVAAGQRGFEEVLASLDSEKREALAPLVGWQAALDTKMKDHATVQDRDALSDSDASSFHEAEQREATAWSAVDMSRLERLCAEGRVTPGVRDRLCGLLQDKATVGVLCLSRDGNKRLSELVLDALSEQPALVLGQRVGAQGVALPDVLKEAGDGLTQQMIQEANRSQV